MGCQIKPEWLATADITGGNKYGGGDPERLEHRKGIQIIIIVTVVERHDHGTPGELLLAVHGIQQRLESYWMIPLLEVIHLPSERGRRSADQIGVERECRLVPYVADTMVGKDGNFSGLQSTQEEGQAEQAGYSHPFRQVFLFYHVK